MHYVSAHPLFRSLSPREVEVFRNYASHYAPPAVDTWLVMHPVVRAEWRRLGKVDANYPFSAEENAANILQLVSGVSA